MRGYSAYAGEAAMNLLNSVLFVDQCNTFPDPSIPLVHSDQSWLQSNSVLNMYFQ